MSDFEGDEMDVDAPAIEFSASNMAAKGKRTAANLPVEAEDTLPWYALCMLASLTSFSSLPSIQG